MTFNDENKTSLGDSSPNEASLLKKVSDSVEKLNYFLNNITHNISMILLFLLMFLTAIDVVGRFFFNHPITGTFELTGILLAFVIFYSLGMLQIKDQHIEIDFLSNKFPRKIQDILKMLISFALFIFLILFTWQLIELMKRLYASNSVSGDLGFPMYIIVALVSIGSFLFTLSYLSQSLNSLLKVVSKDES